MITKDKLLQHKAQLTAERDQHVARANMTSGALLLVDALLADIERNEEPKEAEPEQSLAA